MVEMTTIEERAEEINSIKNETEQYGLRKIFCNDLLYMISGGYVYYQVESFSKDSWVRLFVEQVRKLPKEEYYWKAVAAFFVGNKDVCIKNLKWEIECSAQETVGAVQIGESDIVDLYIEPFKNAYLGFWEDLHKLITPYCKQDGAHKLCKLMGEFYSCEDNDKAAELLLDYIQLYPNITVAKEYLATLYYQMKRWNNAIALFESIDEPMLYANTKDQIFFLLALAYSKIKDLKNEENYYRKCLEMNVYSPYAKNNLAYCLYKQKRFSEAKQLLEECVVNRADMPNAANNYVRVLIAMGRNKDAKSFVSETQEKIAKNLREKVKSLDSSNAKIKKDVLVAIPEDDELATIEKNIVIDIKKHQFTSEKILEDELTSRIDAGIPVFGVNLRIYKRKGEYGRQYQTPVGRLDLFCEDEKGDLYIIELKKDSGYDDAYAQTARYLDWFEQEEKFKGKKIYGIICLNNPTQKLIDKVHADKRMKLYEYFVSYREV